MIYIRRIIIGKNPIPEGTMSDEIQSISLSLPFGLGSVNTYLYKTRKGFLLIDTGSSNQRLILEKELEQEGCNPGTLHLIILTHGDFDHTGNAAYLRKKFGAPIAIHQYDSGMIERGDMFFNRKKAFPGFIEIRIYTSQTKGQR
jgi:hydroxyacylglutathione hydrolase